MKKGLIITSTLALALGVGVAVSAHQQKIERAEATSSTVYCKMQYDWWTVDNAAIGVYYWGGESEATTWPGIRMSKAFDEDYVWKIDVPSDIEGLIFTRVSGSGDVSDYGAKTKDLALPTDGKNLFTITSDEAVWGDPGCEGTWSEYVEPSVSDGYYLVGSETNFKYAGAPAIPALTNDYDGNLAYLGNYTAKADEKVKVRSYFESNDRWSFNVDGTKSYGSQDGEGNFVFSKAGNYDIYVFEQNSELKFSVVEHKERVEITLVQGVYQGAQKINTIIGPVKLLEKGTAFVPSVALSGSTQYEVYDDVNYTEAHDPEELFEYDDSLYIKYIQHNYYLISGAGSYSIANARVMLTEGIGAGNNAEITISVAAANETYSCVYYDGTMHGQTGLGDTYSFAVYEEDHIKFTEAGTYTLYLSKDTKVYINAGTIAFVTGFISEIGGVCKNNGSTDLEALATAWEHQESLFGLLTADQKKEISDIGFNGGDEEGTEIQRMIAKYHYIVTKYGTENCSDFIWGGSYPQSLGFSTSINFNSNGLIVIIIITATVALIGAGVFFILKRKHN